MLVATSLLFVAACSSNGYLAGGTASGGTTGGDRGTGGNTTGRGSGTGGSGSGGSTQGTDAGTGVTPDTGPIVPISSPVEGMPAEVAAILANRCASCHTYGQGDLGLWGSVLDLSRLIDAEIVVPGNPSASRMIDRVVVRGDMPPRGDRVPAGEVATLKSWITSLKRTVSSPRSDEDILDAIAADVLKARTLSSDFRYFSLAHFIDQGRPATEVTRAKNVLAFTVNSLSRRGNIVPMVPIDAEGSIFRIRLSELGWNAALWDQLTGFYPYCLASQVAGHQSLYTQLGTQAPFVRADWLMETATQAPLYDLLVNLPASVNALATQLGVNIANDINHPGLVEPDNLVRFAVNRSGVSLHNRMAERHLGTAGQYLWISYDFKNGVGVQDVFANPLGPKAVDQQGFVHTFSNDAGEVIFTLPNGMQGYMLVNAAGQKVAVADTAIVRDIRRPNGVVANGISCFGCHAPGGMIRPVSTDQMQSYIRSHVGDFLNKEFNEITALYPPVLSPDVLKLDSGRYRGAADTLDGGGPDRGALEYLPFVALVGDYESTLGFRGAAAEFNQDPAAFKATVLANDADNRTLPRSPTDPLISRVDFVCAWRDLAVKIEAKQFCAKTFDAAAVRGLCP
ncbi:MAG TPA: hypothetical protein VFH68_10095 [Polyangia bacterium]|nr:hypothetical protein [Polyangia bacterium]